MGVIKRGAGVGVISDLTFRLCPYADSDGFYSKKADATRQSFANKSCWQKDIESNSVHEQRVLYIYY